MGIYALSCHRDVAFTLLSDVGRFSETQIYAPPRNYTPYYLDRFIAKVGSAFFLTLFFFACNNGRSGCEYQFGEICN